MDEEEELLKKIKINNNLEEYKNAKALDNLKKRGFIEVEEIVDRTIKLTEKGKEFIKNPIEIKEEISQLTREHIISGKWKECHIRPYDVNIPTEDIYPAKLHPMARVIHEVKDILIGMGFKEVKKVLMRVR